MPRIAAADGGCYLLTRVKAGATLLNYRVPEA
jgi:hypothetical protein